MASSRSTWALSETLSKKKKKQKMFLFSYLVINPVSQVKGKTASSSNEIDAGLAVRNASLTRVSSIYWNVTFLL
jgi:hypothetical protein